MTHRLAPWIAAPLLGLAIGTAQAGYIVDDFESGLPTGVDANGIPVGFFTFAGPLGSAGIGTTAPPVAVPGSAAGNQVLQVDLAVTGPEAAGGFAGMAHFFEGPGVDSWVSQDWSAYRALRFWMYGQATGTELFVDILDNRNPGSTSDDAERWVSFLSDDFSGWQEVTLPFSGFVRKDIGNGAPNDGLGLTQVHGWALGSFATPPGTGFSLYVDDVSLVPAPSTLLLVAAAALALRVTRRGRSPAAA